MKKNRSPRVKEIVVVASLALTCGSLAMWTVKDHIMGKDGPLANQLGLAFNKALLGVSNLGMGLSGMHAVRKGSANAVPKGMTPTSRVVESADSPPPGIITLGEDSSLLDKTSKELGKASRKAFISASNIEIYAK